MITRPNVYFDQEVYLIAMTRCGIRSATKLGPLAGISGSYARLIVAGLIPPPDVQQRIAKVLHLTPSQLWRAVPLSEAAELGGVPMK